MTAEELILESIARNTIVHAVYSSELAARLLTLSDDSVDTATEVEYWGTDATWWVHLQILARRPVSARVTVVCECGCSLVCARGGNEADRVCGPK